MTRERKVVVIGAGLGGLAAAIRLAARGFGVTIVESQDAAGGRAGVLRDGGYTFDTGPTVVTAPFLLEELFALAGRRMEDALELVRLDPFYQVRFDDGATFDYHTDPEVMAAEVSKFEPRDVEGYARFLAASKEIYGVGFTRLGDLPFHRLGDMLRVVPSMIRLRSHRSLYGFVASYIRDPRLRMLLSFHPLLIGGNPFTTSSIYALISYLERNFGIWYPRGGVTAIVAALVDLFASLGGELRLGTRVEEILVESGHTTGVRLSGGATLPAEIVVSNADAPATYRRLLPAAARPRHSDRRLARMRYSMGLYVIYLGLRRSYPDLRQHTIVLGPRYEEYIADVFERRVLPDDVSLYVHAPTRTEPSFAPPGGESVYALSPVPHLGGGHDWSREATRHRERVLDRLAATVLPGVREQIAVEHAATPTYFRDALGSEHGAGFSIQPTLTQSAWFRFHNRSPDVRGLYLVGAGTHPGAGIPGVLSTAKVVDRLIPNLDGTGNPRDVIAGSHAM